MIPVSDLRKGNLVHTIFGICPVHHIVFDDIYVLGKDQRVLYAREVEGIEVKTHHLKNVDNILIPEFFSMYKYVHELQNFFYWNFHKELLIS